MRTSLAVLWLAACNCAWAAQWANPAAIVNRAEAFDWKDAAPLGPLVLPNDAGLPNQPTRVGLARDDERLYVGIAATENDWPALKVALADGWSERARDDDSLSVYLRRGTTVYEFTVTSDGRLDDVRWEAARQDAEWSSKAAWKVGHAEQWGGLLTVPMAEIGLDNPAAGDALDFAIVRREKPARETSGWPACGATAELPVAWGTLILGGGDWPRLRDFRLTRPTADVVQFAWLAHPADAVHSIQLLATEEDEPVAVPIEAVNRAGWWSCRHELEPGSVVRLQAVLTAGGRVLHATPVLRFEASSPVARAKEATTRVRALATQAAKITDEASKMWIDYAMQTLGYEAQSYEAEAKKALAKAASPERRQALAELAGNLQRLEWRINLTDGRFKAVGTGGAADAFAVGTAGSLVKLRRFDADLDYGRPVQLRCARGERQSAQLVIVPFDTELEGVTVTWCDLLGSGEGKIAAKDMAVHLVGYVQTTPPAYPVDYVGWWPDPLLPLEESFTVEAYQTQPLWLTVYARPGTAAGLYRGEVKVAVEDIGEVKVPLEVEVLDYDLPKEQHLRVGFAFDWPGLAAWYGYKPDTKTRPAPPRIPAQRIRQVMALARAYGVAIAAPDSRPSTDAGADHGRPAAADRGTPSSEGPGGEASCDFLIDRPAVEHRAAFWRLPADKDDALECGRMNDWAANMGADPRWPDGPWLTAGAEGDNGGGFLVYPGKDAVLASIRLANIRDGIQDSGALRLLADLTARLKASEHATLIEENHKALAAAARIADEAGDAPARAKALLEARRAADEQIVMTQRALSMDSGN